MRKNIPPAYLFLLFSFTSVVYSQAGVDSLPVVKPVNHAGVSKLIQQSKGRVVLVNAWATWCAPCREEMPGLLKMRTEYRDKDFELVLISADDSEKVDSVVRPMLKKFGVDFVSYINNESTDEAFITGMNPDWSGALPASFIYDKDGKFVEMMVGGKTFEAFEKAVLRYLQ